jgi:hypothetical protein
MLHFGKILSPVCAFPHLDTMSPQKLCNSLLPFFGACGNVSGMLMLALVKDNWMLKVK